MSDENEALTDCDRIEPVADFDSDDELEKSYRAMAADLEAEAEALEWIEGAIGDIGDEPWDD
jgi:hypothetical protein